MAPMTIVFLSMALATIAEGIMPRAASPFNPGLLLETRRPVLDGRTSTRRLLCRQRLAAYRWKTVPEDANQHQTN